MKFFRWGRVQIRVRMPNGGLGVEVLEAALIELTWEELDL